MTIGLLREPAPETRVSLLPEHIKVLQKWNSPVIVEHAAGENAFASDEQYIDAGATIAARNEVLRNADLLLAMQPLAVGETSQLNSKMLLGIYNPLFDPGSVATLAANNLTVFSMDMLPRTTRAQSMDVLSSQANIAGYKAVLEAASLYPRYFPMFMTAAGSVAPAKVLILGAGVAGLQAIATAKRLGAVVEVFDTRPAVKEEVMSLGAKFIEVQGAADAAHAGGYAVEQSQEFMERQKARIAESVAKADIIITTAQIPGRRAPILITEEMIRNMRSGSVIIDMAAQTGGNTDITENNKTIEAYGVRIIGNSMLASGMPADASKLYGKNVLNFLQLLLNKAGSLELNFNDELVKGTCIAHGGQVTNERIRNLGTSGESRTGN